MSAVASSTNLTVQLEMDFTNGTAPALFAWTLPVAPGNQGTIETSTNLTDWAPVITLTSRGTAVHWRHNVAQAQRYFRVVAN